MNRLVLQPATNTSEDVITSNLAATFKRGYKPLTQAEGYRGPISLVGAGPSLAWTYKDLVGDVMACNSAHDYLLGKGIVPQYTMLWDAHPVMANMITTPHPKVKYLVASRCHPSVFEKLKDCDVTVWHAMGGDDALGGLLAKHGRNELLVPGGTSSIMRATHLAGALGYAKEVHLFGIDSCCSGGKTHVKGSLTDQNTITLIACGKPFMVAPWMAMQAEDFKVFAPLLRANGMRLVVHGTGLIPYIATFLDIETPDMKVSVYERMRRHLHGLLLIYRYLRNSPQLLGGFNAGN